MSACKKLSLWVDFVSRAQGRKATTFRKTSSRSRARKGADHQD